MRALAVLFLIGSLATPARADPPAQALRAGHGSVYLTAGKSGIVAHTVDGKFQQVLVPGPIGASALDAVWELIWFVKDKKLMVLDLREDAPPVTLITGIPAGHGFEVDQGGANLLAGDGLFDLAWSGADEDGKGEATLSIDGDVDPQDDEYKDPNTPPLFKEARKAKILPAGQEWFVKQARRKDGPNGLLVKPRWHDDKLALADGVCNAGIACGRSTDFGKTGLWLVLDNDNCQNAAGRDDCYMSCAIYDPASKKFGDASKPTEWKAPLKKAIRTKCAVDWAKDGTAWISDGLVCTTAGCKKVEPLLGWLERSDELDLSDVEE